MCVSLNFCNPKYRSVFSVKEVRRWIENLAISRKESLFWNEAIYFFSETYRSFSPVMRFCIDMRIRGMNPKDIAHLMNRPANSVYKTLARAKKRILSAVIG